MCREFTCFLSPPKVSTSCVGGGRDDNTALLYSLMADEQNNPIRFPQK